MPHAPRGAGPASLATPPSASSGAPPPPSSRRRAVRRTRRVDAGAFAKVYGGTQVEKELKKAHARGAVIGVTHACSAVLCDRAGTETGFGLLPGFAFGTQRQIDAAMKNNPTCVGLRIPDGAG